MHDCTFEPEDDECICPVCGERSRVDYVDEGIGPTEYWGSVANHSDWVKISMCCKEELALEDLI